MWTPRDKARFITALTATCELYGRGMSDKAKAFYVRVLEKHITADEAIRAIEAHIAGTGKESTFFPKPADLLRSIEGSPDDLVEQAWQLVRNAVERIGGYQSVVFRDPIINACIQDMGGWVYLCHEVATDTKRFEFAAHEFRRLYRGYLQTKQVPNVSYLPGETEKNNRALGYWDDENTPPPLMLGDPLPDGIQKHIRAIEPPTIGEPMAIEKIIDEAKKLAIGGE